MKKQLWILFLSVLLLSACTKWLALDEEEVELPPSITEIKQESTANFDQLRLKYYGIGSVLLEYNNKAVLTDPCWTNLPMRDVMFGKIKTDREGISLMHPELDHVEFTLVAHSHYDHLMDLPFIAKNYLNPKSKIVGSTTTSNLMYSAALEQPFVNALPFMGSNEKEGDWLYNEDETVRVMVLESHHPPQVLGVLKLGGGTVDEALQQIPDRASDWKEGETLAFLIDYLDPAQKSKIKKRVYFQSSEGKVPQGIPPASVLRQRQIDVAVIAGITKIQNLKKKIEVLNAKQNVIVHWENFFRAKNLEAKPMSPFAFSRLKRFIKENNLQNRVQIAQPGEALDF